MRKTQSKRKMSQKRRKKEKLQNRKKQTQQSSTVCDAATTQHAATSEKKKNNNNSKHHNSKRPQDQMTSHTCTSGNLVCHNNDIRNNNHHNGIDQSPFSGYMNGIWKWWQTYNTAMEYHKTQARQLQAVDTEEGETQNKLLERFALEYETSSDEEDEDEDVNGAGKDDNGDDDDDETTVREVGACVQRETAHSDDEMEDNVDLEYIKFMEITYRHREELKQQRAAENLC